MRLPPLSPMMLCHPTVCAVGRDYHIMLPVREETLMSVVVGEETFYDESNGILRSKTPVHRAVVPMEALDAAGRYTLRLRQVLERRPYYPPMGDTIQLEYEFRPLKKREDIHIYQLADMHGMIEPAARAARFFGDSLDLLVLNGDMANSSASPEDICAVYRVAALVTGGQIPCVFSRGNHDTRGACAENLADYVPTDRGNSYYDFQLGCVYGLALDCGEDKDDDNASYNGTICCHSFRRRETRFLQQTMQAKPFLAPEVQYRLVLSHIPFTYNHTAADHDGSHPFNIEIPLYTQWARLLREEMRPHLMLCGHLHRLLISMPGGPYDQKGQPCPVIIGSHPEADAEGGPRYAGTALTLRPGSAWVAFTNQDGEILRQETLAI